MIIKLGWRGGHFFPLIFSGISLGYGFALLLGIDPVFSCAACTAACMAAVMRQPLMVALLLFMCFPVKGVAVMFVAALLAAAIPLPTCIKPQEKGAAGDKAMDGAVVPADAEPPATAAPAATARFSVGSW